MLSDRPDAHTKPSATVYAQSPRALYCIYLYAPADAPPCIKQIFLALEWSLSNALRLFGGNG